MVEWRTIPVEYGPYSVSDAGEVRRDAAAVINEYTAAAIRHLHAHEFSKAFIAKAFRIDSSRISKIINGTLWKVTA